MCLSGRSRRGWFEEEEGGERGGSGNPRAGGGSVFNLPSHHCHRQNVDVDDDVDDEHEMTARDDANVTGQTEGGKSSLLMVERVTSNRQQFDYAQILSKVSHDPVHNARPVWLTPKQDTLWSCAVALPLCGLSTIAGSFSTDNVSHARQL